jgi:hypothetical protein
VKRIGDVRATGEADLFGVFENVCAAAGVETPAERLGVFFNLPPSLQDGLWRELAARVNADDKDPSP